MNGRDNKQYCFANCRNGFGSGLYIFLADALKLPRMAVTKAVLNVSRQDKKQTKILEVFDLSSKLANHIRLDEYKKRKLTSTIRSAGIYSSSL